MVCLVALWLLLAVVFLMLCGCTAKKVVMEREVIHDTLIVSKTDTVRVNVLNLRHDTVRVESERVVTLLQPSDKSLPAETIRIESNNWRFEREIVKDSASKVVARVDSILKALDKQKQQSQKNTQPMSWKGFFVFLIVIGGLCIWVLVKTKIKV